MAMMPLIKQINALTRKRLALKLRALEVATELAKTENDLKTLAARLTDDLDTQPAPSGSGSGRVHN